jgi:hypothetical protein
LDRINEINDYIDGCHIGPSEAYCHTFEFPMHEESPTVYRLSVHHKDQQIVFFNPGDEAVDVADCAVTRIPSSWHGSRLTSPFQKQTTTSIMTFLRRWYGRRKRRSRLYNNEVLQ